MERIIYAIKIGVFRDQLKTSASEKRGIQDHLSFPEFVHNTAWITAPIGMEASTNDFRLMIELSYPHAANSSATRKRLGSKKFSMVHF